jgi:two-component system, cell cycle sensor histidine kinase and response regulator CckA
LSNRSPIGRKLMIMIVAFSTTITVITTGTQLFFDYKKELGGLYRQIEGIKTIQVNSLSHSMWTFDSQGIQIIIDNLLNIQDIEYLYVYINDKHFWSGGKLVSRRTIDTTIPISFNDSQEILAIGSLRIVASLDNVYERLLQKAVLIFLGNGFKTFFVALFILYLFQRLVTRHVVDLGEYANKVASGVASTPFRLNRKKRTKAAADELDSAASAINLMRENLHDEIQKIKQAEEALMFTRASVEAASDAIFWIKPDGSIVDVNDAACRSLGYTREELLQLSVVDVDPLAKREAWEKYFQQLRELRTLRFESLQNTKDGEIFPVEIVANYVCHNHEERYCAIVRNISERKLAEEALRVSGEDLKESQRIAHVGSWRLDIASNQVEWSEELYRIYGFDPSLPPPPFTEHRKLFTPESWERLSTALQHTRDTKIPYDLELETLRIDGSHGWMWVHGLAEVNATQEITGLRGMAQDITDRKQSEEALRESEARFKTLHNASFGGIAVHDQGVILECNQGLSEISGFSKEELIGMDGLLLISEKSRGMVLQNIRDGYEKPYEAVGLRKNNEEYPVRLEARNIPYKGKTARVVEFRDITEQKRQEAEKSQLEHILHQSQKMEAIGQLAGGVAHDFNNMLGVISGYSEMILERTDPSHQFHAELEEILKASRRSADLTRQLLTFARKQTVAPKVLDLNQTIEGMLKMLRRLIGENISLIWMPGSGLWPINMDPSQIDQILANLCVNARDAIAGIGKLTVETGNAIFDREYCATHAGSLAGEYVRIAISDTGSGMDKGTLAHIFEPFFTTKGLGEGTGLGLATVYGAVKQNNGFINAYSEPGQGTTITIYIPRHVETATERRASASPASVVRGNEIVMLVEDEPTLLQMSKTMLERLGYTVLTAGTPNEAIRLAGEYSGQIHLLATDVIMPEMNGRELSLRLMESRPEMKCLFMSGYTANIIANQGMLKERVSFIQKPFSKAELATKIRDALAS